MSATEQAVEVPSVTLTPTRLHHFAFTTHDMAATRHFYEDLVGMPLRQTWVEQSIQDGEVRDEYLHCFFALDDGGAIAYFQFAGRPPVAYPEPQVSFHIAFKVSGEAQRGIIERLRADGYPEGRLTDHGYCVSFYITDPNGLRLEFTVDHERIEEIVTYQAATARAELERWLAGDHSTNNSWRPHA